VITLEERPAAGRRRSTSVLLGRNLMASSSIQAQLDDDSLPPDLLSSRPELPALRVRHAITDDVWWEIYPAADSHRLQLCSQCAKSRLKIGSRINPATREELPNVLERLRR